jgi:nitrogen fixation protein NifU and related proteins
MDSTMYKEFILELYRNPLHHGVLPVYDLKVSGTNPACGDDIEIYIQWDGAGHIKDISHTGSGCAISQAALSLLTDAVKGKTREDITNMTKDDMASLLGIEVDYTREKCLMLGLMTLKKSFLV